MIIKIIFNVVHMHVSLLKSRSLPRLSYGTLCMVSLDLDERYATLIYLFIHV